MSAMPPSVLEALTARYPGLSHAQHSDIRRVMNIYLVDGKAACAPTADWRGHTQTHQVTAHHQMSGGQKGRRATKAEAGTQKEASIALVAIYQRCAAS
jgi:hypothetical protein